MQLVNRYFQQKKPLQPITTPAASRTRSPGETKSVRPVTALLTIPLTMSSVSGEGSGSPTTGPNVAVLMLMPSTVRSSQLASVTRAMVPLLANVLRSGWSGMMTVMSCGVKLTNFIVLIAYRHQPHPSTPFVTFLQKIRCLITKHLQIVATTLATTLATLWPNLGRTLATLWPRSG